MARVTVEDCIEKIPNRFDLILKAAQRSRNISGGELPLINPDQNKNPTIALREIASADLDLDALEETMIRNLQTLRDHDEPDILDDEDELAAALEDSGDFANALNEDLLLEQENQAKSIDDELDSLNDELTDGDIDDEDGIEDSDEGLSEDMQKELMAAMDFSDDIVEDKDDD